MTVLINQTGPVECFPAGGGIYISAMPVTINGKKAYITYDSECLYNDSKNIVEFTVYDLNLNDMLSNFFDAGVYVENRKKSQYKKLFIQLKSALKKELKKHKMKVN